MTGDVESYLLYKEIDQGHDGWDDWDQDDELEQDELLAMN